jgi:hypothetical protein
MMPNTNDDAKRNAYHLNAPGDFYVVAGLCIACTAPEHEAPALMAHDETEEIGYHCYFKRQPENPDEIQLAIRAIRVGCCGAVRYGGHNPQIIQQLMALGSRDDCDKA